MKKSLLRIFFVLVLCLSMLPAIALAAEHTDHADENHDHLCDVCSMPHYNTDENFLCNGDGCNAVETEISAEYTNLYYYENYEEPGELLVGGALRVTVNVRSSGDNSPKQAVNDGKILVYWTNSSGDTVPFSEMWMPVRNGIATVYFGGIPIESLSRGHLMYYPPENSAESSVVYLPSSGTADTSSLRTLSVSSNVNLTVNYAPATVILVLPGATISIDLLVDAEGSYVVSLDGTAAEYQTAKDGKAVTFTMPDKNVAVTVTWVSCTVHADGNKDHKCDVCAGTIACVDANKNHKCDIGDEVLSVCSDGITADHKCDICKKAMTELCMDTDLCNHFCDNAECNRQMTELCTDTNASDHICDNAVCKRQMTELCTDSDLLDHYCDNAACKRQLTYCESSDSNKDDICDVCQAPLYWLEVKGIKVTAENKANILGDESASVTYNPDTKTLTLKNANVQTTGNYGIRSKLPKSNVLNIQLIGENRVSASGVYGLRSTADVVISGSGSLDISAGDIAIYLDGAGSEYGSLTVCENAIVRAAGGRVTSGNGFGVKVDDCLTVRDNAKLTASSVSAPDRSSGVYAIDVVTVQDNAELVATGGDLSGKAGTDSYGIRTTHIYVHGGTLTATGGDAADSIGIYTQTFDMTGGKVYAYGANSVLGPSYGLRSNKYVNMSGGAIVAIGGEAPNDQSCGLMVNNTSSDSVADDGGTLTVTGGEIYAVAKTGAFSHGIKANNIAVSGGAIIAEAAEAETTEGGMTISSGITAESNFSVTGGAVSAKSSAAGTYSYGLQAFAMTVDGGSVVAESGSAATSYGLWSFNKMNLSDISTVIQASSENGYAVYAVKGISVEEPLCINRPLNGAVVAVADGPETYYVISSDNGAAAKTALISARAAFVPEMDYNWNTYPVVEKEIEDSNGTVSFSKTTANSGETVTVTVAPDKYYSVGTVIVRNEKGEQIQTTRNADGTYSFKMPAGKVSVEAVYIWENPFADVAEDAFYTAAVEWALKNSITEGTSENTFSPNVSCNRAQMMTFLWRAAGSPEPKRADCPFTDMDMDSYYGKAVLWAIENGITNGTSDTAFSPDMACSRAQMAAFLCRMAGGKANGNEHSFDDVEKDAYYAEAIRWAVGNGITEGTGDNKYSPDAVCSRGQMVTFLYRYYN